jgi:hypothetical protein
MDAEEKHDMGTGTDPNDIRDINVSNPGMLDILEKELMRGKPSLQSQMMASVGPKSKV